MELFPEEEALEEDRKDGCGEAKDDKISDGHEGDGGKAAQPSTGHQEAVQGDHCPLGKRYRHLHFFNVITILHLRLESLFPRDEDNSEQNHLHHTPHQGHLCGLQHEPAHQIVVQNVEDVRHQDEGHSSKYRLPT